MRPGGVTPASSASSEALQAEIKQVLQGLSSDLEQLQAKLDAQPPDRIPSTPGTATDPDLYDESVMPLAKGQGATLPLQLDADAAPTAKARPGGGMGQPDATAPVSNAKPRAADESAELADHAAPEAGVQRQPIPPEYKPVFEELQSNPDQHQKEPG